MKLFRFELAFDGEPQDIGILRGLDDIGLPEGVSVNIEEDFNELPCPKFSEAVSFWFTEFGVQAFQATLDYLVEQSMELNWQILYAELPGVSISKALYADQFQVALPLGMVEELCPQYRELRTVSDILVRRS